MSRGRPSPRLDDRGQLTLWALGLCLMLLVLGGLTLDLWRAFSAHQALAAAADSAATAGASGLDEGAFRTTGVVALDPAAAERLAYDNLAAHASDREITAYRASATADDVTVTVDGTVDLSLLRLLPGRDGVAMSVDATAEPRPSG